MLTPLRRPPSFPKIPSEQIHAVRPNQRIIGGDACDGYEPKSNAIAARRMRPPTTPTMRVSQNGYPRYWAMVIGKSKGNAAAYA